MAACNMFCCSSVRSPLLPPLDFSLESHACFRAIAAATEITFKEAETVKAFLADPSAFAAAAPAAAAAAAPAAAAAAAPPPKEESEEEDDDMGFGLFD